MSKHFSITSTIFHDGSNHGGDTIDKGSNESNENGEGANEQVMVGNG